MIRKFSLVGTALVAFAAAQSTPPKSNPSPDGITRQQADAILSELREMRLLLEKLTKMPTAAPAARAPAAKVSLKIAPEAVMLGDKNAPLTMVEYIDMQCPFCKRFQESTFAEIRKNLIDTGKLRYYSRDYPLEGHSLAMKAAVATHCAAEQGKFWHMRELLLTNSANLAPDAILGYAKTAGLDTAAFGPCFANAKYEQTIRSSISEGSSIGVQGTPSILVGRSTTDGVTGIVMAGARPYSVFEAEVKKLEGN